MIYLTYNDQPSGVYSSQVSDVCTFLSENYRVKIRLIAFVSLHDFRRSRKIIRGDFPGAMVLPALPKAKYWKFSALVFILICMITGERRVIARNILATHIALLAKKAGVIRKICLDGRGAIAAEWNEYHVVPDEMMKKAITGQEQSAVLNADFRIAVSSKLVNYWQETFGYNKSDHIVIPCTLNSRLHYTVYSDEDIRKQREVEGFEVNDIVMVYSGSTAGWQSLDALGNILGKLLAEDKKYKLLFLCKEDKNITLLKSQFPGQVYNRWISYHDVKKILVACDYGILFREYSITNKVASPTKFAEYLSSGLPVIISENLGDYSDFVRREQCGLVITNQKHIDLPKPLVAEKQQAIRLAAVHFTKEANSPNYQTLINFLNK